MILAIVLSFSLLAQTAQPSQPGVPEAFAAIQAQDWTRAAQIAGDVTTREPKNAAAWRLLAVAQIRLKQYDKALASLATSREIDPTNAVAIYNTAITYALSGNKDSAFEW